MTKRVKREREGASETQDQKGRAQTDADTQRASPNLPDVLREGTRSFQNTDRRRNGRKGAE